MGTLSSNRATARVALVAMPFASVNYPCLGISLLQAELKNRNLPCETLYLNTAFAEQVGLKNYVRLSDEWPFLALIGEWLFTDAVFGDNDEANIAYLNTILLGRFKGRLRASDILDLLAIKSLVAGFLDFQVSDIDWSSYAIIGFTTSFQQTNASLALAQRIRRVAPNAQIVFGGANCEGEMGSELLRTFPFVDAVCRGEGDISFPSFVDAVLAGTPEPQVPGMLHRSALNGKVPMEPHQAAPVRNMDSLAVPDFSDFFRQHRAHFRNVPHRKPVLVFEASRGCWWGEKSHCTFCGLNGLGMNYRSKTQRRANQELNELTKRHGKEVLVVDNILDLNYFREFFPRLIEEKSGLQLHFETKVNLKPEQLSLLKKAGVCKIQPGIETLHDDVLKLMRKGCNLLQCLQLLRFCSELNISVSWNFLYGFPEERSGCYDEMTALLPSIMHLTPPEGVGEVRADRFSPLFEEPIKFGITALTPIAAYTHVLRLPQESQQRLAYFFAFECQREPSHLAAVTSTLEGIAQWQEHHATITLTITPLEDGCALLEDTRLFSKVSERLLQPLSVQVLGICRVVRSIKGVIQELHSGGHQPVVVRQTIARLVESSLLIRNGEQILSLVMMADRASLDLNARLKGSCPDASLRFHSTKMA